MLVYTAISGGIGMIQRLDALQRALIWDIIKTVGVVVATIPIWFFMNINKSAAIADYYDNYCYIEAEELNHPVYKLEKMSDLEGLMYVETQDILVSNYSRTLDSYYLLLSSNDDSDNVRININNIVNNLNDFEKINKDGNTYYILEHTDLVAGSHKYNISLWQKEGADEDVNFDYLISVQNSI